MFLYKVGCSDFQLLPLAGLRSPSRDHGNPPSHPGIFLSCPQCKFNLFCQFFCLLGGHAQQYSGGLLLVLHSGIKLGWLHIKQMPPCCTITLSPKHGFGTMSRGAQGLLLAQCSEVTLGDIQESIQYWGLNHVLPPCKVCSPTLPSIAPFPCLQA